ncbi:hypothetical protein [Methylotuvimicrobium sp. KM2]|uniref:hypothetical protein n=1 Tax=Methylotuvimicrobium sp. KM2 TaxID=3133976 RepID=UPI003101B36A
MKKGHCKREKKSEINDEHGRLIEEPRLFDQLFSTLYLSAGFEQVKKNKGKSGIDGVMIADFEARLDEELSRCKRDPDYV